MLPYRIGIKDAARSGAALHMLDYKTPGSADQQVVDRHAAVGHLLGLVHSSEMTVKNSLALAAFVFLAAGSCHAQEPPEIDAGDQLFLLTAVLYDKAGQKTETDQMDFVGYWAQSLERAEVHSLFATGNRPRSEDAAVFTERFHALKKIMAQRITPGFCYFVAADPLNVTASSYWLEISLTHAQALRRDPTQSVTPLQRRYIFLNPRLNFPKSIATAGEYSDYNKAAENADSVLKVCATWAGAEKATPSKEALGLNPLPRYEHRFKLISVAVVSSKTQKSMFNFPGSWISQAQ